MKYFIITFLLFFTLPKNLHAGVVGTLLKGTIKAAKSLKSIPEPMDEVPGMSFNKVIPENSLDNFTNGKIAPNIKKFVPENSSDEILSYDLSKTFVDDTEDALINSEIKETANSNSNSKSIYALPATGGIVYSKKQTDENKINELNKKTNPPK